MSLSSNVAMLQSDLDVGLRAPVTVTSPTLAATSSAHRQALDIQVRLHAMFTAPSVFGVH